jgi:hypothetical protein
MPIYISCGRFTSAAVKGMRTKGCLFARICSDIGSRTRHKLAGGAVIYVARSGTTGKVAVRVVGHLGTGVATDLQADIGPAYNRIPARRGCKPSRIPPALP